jgi:hypothetical protein
MMVTPKKTAGKRERANAKKRVAVVASFVQALFVGKDAREDSPAALPLIAVH